MALPIPCMCRPEQAAGAAHLEFQCGHMGLVLQEALLCSRFEDRNRLRVRLSAVPGSDVTATDGHSSAAQEPLVAATLADITCDSDGKLDKFVSAREGVDFDPILPLHRLEPGSKYYLAMFLTGVCVREKPGMAQLSMQGVLRV